jgi:hypothetical protein
MKCVESPNENNMVEEPIIKRAGWPFKSCLHEDARNCKEIKKPYIPI